MRYRLLALGIVAVMAWGLIGTGSLYAHTTLTSADPEPDTTVTEELNEIVLTFNTDVETSSTFTLLLDGVEQELGPIEVEGQFVRGVVDTPLANGEYTVAWRIVGEDGHPIQSEYAFTLAAPEPEPAEEPAEEPTEQPVEEPAEQPTPTEETPAPADDVDEPASPDASESTEAPTSETAEPTASASTTWIWVVVGAVVVVAIGWGLIGSRRRKR